METAQWAPEMWLFCVLLAFGHMQLCPGAPPATAQGLILIAGCSGNCVLLGTKSGTLACLFSPVAARSIEASAPKLKVMRTTRYGLKPQILSLQRNTRHISQELSSRVVSNTTISLFLEKQTHLMHHFLLFVFCDLFRGMRTKEVQE